VIILDCSVGPIEEGEIEPRVGGEGLADEGEQTKRRRRRRRDEAVLDGGLQPGRGDEPAGREGRVGEAAIEDVRICYDYYEYNAHEQEVCLEAVPPVIRIFCHPLQLFFLQHLYRPATMRPSAPTASAMPDGPKYVGRRTQAVVVGPVELMKGSDGTSQMGWWVERVQWQPEYK